MPSDDLTALLARAAHGTVAVLTGAGISAASGIPTFRGREGLWTVGAREYTPQVMATRAFFARHPELVWAWYLYRRGRCLAAQPNAAHRALAELETRLHARFALVTQNVDDLHRRAGNTAARTFEIHGNIHWMRCADACSNERWPVMAARGPRERGAPLPATEREVLRCPRCRGWARPHVLWFDESYDELHYRSDSAWQAVSAAALLLVIGTSGTTTLPRLMAAAAAARRIPIVAVDPRDNPLTALATMHGVHVRQEAVTAVPVLVQRLAPVPPPAGAETP